MSIVASHVILGIEFPEEALQRVVDQWADGLKTNAQRINDKRKIKIPTAEEFQARVAEPANLKYTPFVNPSFVNRSGQAADAIIKAHQANISRAFQKYNSNLDFLFATVDGIPAKRFKDLIDNARNNFSRGIAARTLTMTGTGLEALGPAPLAALWLAGEGKVLDALRPGDQVIEGGPFLICRDTDRPSLKAALNQRLIQAGVDILKSGLDAATILAQNNRTNRLIQGFVEPALGLVSFTSGGASHVDFILINGRPYLEVMVSRS